MLRRTFLIVAGALLLTAQALPLGEGPQRRVVPRRRQRRHVQQRPHFGPAAADGPRPAAPARPGR